LQALSKKQTNGREQSRRTGRRAIAQYTPDQAITAYVKVLQELAALKNLARAPEEVLPLPKEELLTLLQRSTHPNRERLIGLLDTFESGATRDLFLSRLIVRPAILTLVYAAAIAVQGASWLWVPIAVLGGVGAFFAARKWAWFEAWATLPKWKRWAWLLRIELGELAAVGCWSAIWVRLVIMGGLYGLYQSVWVRLDGFGIFAALLSLVLGYFFSKQFTAFFFFVTQYARRRQFRGDQRPGV
jgi:hypothetical protein